MEPQIDNDAVESGEKDNPDANEQQQHTDSDDKNVEMTASDAPVDESQQEQPEEADPADAVSSSKEPPPAMLTDPLQRVPIWVETITRMTLASLLAFCLGVANIPNAIPESQAFIVGILGSIVAIRIPTVAATPLMSIMLFQTVIVLICAFASALLCAVTVSNGLFVAMSSLFGLWASGLRYGKFEKIHGGLTSMFVAIVALFAFSLYQTVRDGVSFTASNELLEALNEVIDTITNATGIVLPDGQYEGQTADLIVEDNGDITVHVHGGTWWVAQFWTADILNPLAVFPNFFAVCGWCMLCAFTSAMLPPWRTTRFMFSRLLLPQMLKDAAWYIRRQTEKRPGAELTKDEALVRGRLLATSNVVFGGEVAILSAFEPRLLDNIGKLPRCTWIKLKELMNVVDFIAMKALTTRLRLTNTSELAVENTVQSLEKSATALEKKEIKDSTNETDVNKTDDEDIEADAEGKEYDPFQLEEAGEMVIRATEEWHKSLHPTDKLTFKDASKQFLMNAVVFFAPTVTFLVRLAIIPFLPVLLLLGKYSLEAEKAFACIKFAIGFTALTCMVVYWDQFRSLEILSDNPEDATVPTSFSGWLLCAYCFCTMKTSEGSIKKGFQRVIGVCFGAFSAWLLLRATGDNLYGMVAWLTVATAIGLYFSVDKSAKARMGPSKDHSYGGFYFIITQSIIALEYSTGGYPDGDELVVSRLTANLVGIAMATFLSWIPLRTMGSSPKHAQLILDEIVTASNRTIELALDRADPKDLQALHKTYTKEGDFLRGDALYLMEDASRMSWIPYLKVDPVLEAQVAAMTVTATAVRSLMEHLSGILQRDPDAFSEGSDNRAVLVAMQPNIKTATPGSAPQYKEISASAKYNRSEGDEEFFVKGWQVVQARIAEHQAALDGVKWWKGFFRK